MEGLLRERPPAVPDDGWGLRLAGCGKSLLRKRRRRARRRALLAVALAAALRPSPREAVLWAHTPVVSLRPEP